MSTTKVILPQRIALPDSTSTFLSQPYVSSRRFLSSLTSSSSSSSSLSRIPKGSWDCHMHVVDPKKFPLDSQAAYIPATHSLGQAMSFEATVGLSNIVLVQPSIYGSDNSCLLAALEELGPQRARGVVAFNPKTIDRKTLDTWHKLGVRGVRYNLKSVGRSVSNEELRIELQEYADIIRPLGWVLELFIGMEMVPFLESIVSQLNVPLCLAHFAAPTLVKGSTSPYSVRGFGSLISLLEQGSVYVKLSAPYRLNTGKEQRDLDLLAKEMIRVAGKTRLVFATDWPHTRFDDIDIKPFTKRCLDWCEGDDELVERLFRGTAEDLWGMNH